MMVGEMDNIKILNDNNVVNNLQVSCLHDIPAGNFSPGRSFVVKNLTDDEVALNVRLVSQDDFVSTKLYPGWNPEILIEIEDVPDGVLQYGY